MRHLTVTICLSIAVLLGSVGVSESADFQKGYAAYKSDDFATALQEFKPLAEQGHATAQYNLGEMYRKGQGVLQDDKTAVEWYTLAAEQGNTDAQFNLGVAYATGQGVTQDKVYAQIWNIAASSGNKDEVKSKMLQRGHRMMHEGNIDAAIEFYKQSLKVQPDFLAAKSSLRGALRKKKIKIQLDKMDPECGEKSENIEVQKRCLKKYFFFDGKPIQPKIIKDFTTWISDGGDQVVAINLEGSQYSNRYCCESDVDFEFYSGGTFSAHIAFKNDIDPQDGWFTYWFLGATENGIIIVRSSDNGGGTLTSSYVSFFKLRERYSLEKNTDGIVKSVNQRIYIEKLGYFLNKYKKITVDGNFIILDGKKMKVPTIP
jgi:tetratricopeptide (TPR) repeat protein